MSNNFNAIPLTTFDTSGLTGSYATLNGTGIEQPVKILKVINKSDTDITISYDGTTDQDIVSAGDAFIIDVQANNETGGGRRGYLRLSKGQIIYGKGSAGTGNVYIIGYY